MDRRLFLKGAAATVAVAPVAGFAAPAPILVAAESNLFAGTITMAKIAEGSIMASKITAEQVFRGYIWLDGATFEESLVLNELYHASNEIRS